MRAFFIGCILARMMMTHTLERHRTFWRQVMRALSRLAAMKGGACRFDGGPRYTDPQDRPVHKHRPYR